MSFGEWKAYTGRGMDYGRDLSLNIGRENSPGTFEMVTEIGATGATITRETPAEGTNPSNHLRIPIDIGEAIYHALDRIFGQENTDGKVEALEAALNKERARVDFVLQSALQPRAQHQVSTPTGGNA